MSLIDPRHVCSNCSGYDLPLGLRKGRESECNCGKSIYEAEPQSEHSADPDDPESRAHLND